MAKVALLIDAENVPVAHLEQILRHAAPFGALTIRRVFGDFSHARLADWQVQAVAAGFLIVHEPTAGTGKNSTDIRLTVDAMEIAAARSVDRFCIASSDRDFLPLIRRLRETGYDVLGIGRSTSDERLRGACSDFAILDLPPKTPVKAVPAPAQAAPRPAPTAKAPASQQEREAIAGLLRAMSRASGGAISPTNFGTELRRQHPKLAEKIGGSGLVKRLVNQGLALTAGEGSGKALLPMPELRLVK